MTVWKIGAWPGWPGNNWSVSNKRKFAEEHALLEDYVAVFGNCEEHCNRRESCANSGKQCMMFRNEIKPKNIVLLYVSCKETYVGEVVKPYYYASEVPHLRIGVRWLFDKKPKETDFSQPRRSTVYRVTNTELRSKIKDERLRLFLEQKLNNKAISKTSEQIEYEINGAVEAGIKYERNPHKESRIKLLNGLKGIFPIGLSEEERQKIAKLALKRYKEKAPKISNPTPKRDQVF